MTDTPDAEPRAGGAANRAPEVRRGGGLPFGQVLNAWMCDPRYSPAVRTLYAILVSYADVRGRDTARGRPWRPALAAQLGVSVSTLDRAVLEGECAGLWRVEKRADPRNPKLNDANVYHLNDADALAGEWTDPLGPDQSAADAASALLKERREAKRAAGVAPKGGRRKHPATDPENDPTPPGNEGGGIAHNATPTGGGGVVGNARGGIAHYARVALPTTPYVYNHVYNPPQEPLDRPSVPTPEVVACEAATDGRTDGEVVQEQQGQDAPAAGRGAGARLPAPTAEAFWVIEQIGLLEPKLRGIGGVPLVHQARRVDGLLAGGYSRVQLAGLLGGPIDTVRTSPANVVSARISALPPVPADSLVLPPHAPWDGPGPQGQRSAVDHSSTAVADRPVRSAVEARAPLHDCEGDQGLCPRLAIRGQPMCGEHLGWDHCPQCVTRWLRPGQQHCDDCRDLAQTDAGYEAAVQMAFEAAGTDDYYDSGQFLRDAAAGIDTGAD